MRFDLGDSQLSRVFFSSNSLQSARHSPRTEPFIPIPNSTMTTNAIPRCPITRHATCRRPAARAPGAKAGKHPTLGNHDDDRALTGPLAALAGQWHLSKASWGYYLPNPPVRGLAPRLVTLVCGAFAARAHLSLHRPYDSARGPLRLARAFLPHTPATTPYNAIPMRSGQGGNTLPKRCALLAGTLAGDASLLSLSLLFRALLALKRGI